MPDVQAQELTAQLHAELIERGATVATAESLTGGALGDLVSAAPGASESYVGGVVCYATRVKQQLLGVSEDVVARHGVVSAPCAEQLARGVRELLGADYAASTTGVAGPTTQEGKPVGLVYVGVAGPEGVWSRELHLSGDRPEIRRAACLAAVEAVLEAVVRPPADRITPL
jgi:PncC family amidohydrolase